MRLSNISPGDGFDASNMTTITKDIDFPNNISIAGRDDVIKDGDYLGRCYLRRRRIRCPTKIHNFLLLVFERSDCRFP